MAAKQYIYLPDGKIPVDSSAPKTETNIEKVMEILKTVSSGS